MRSKKLVVLVEDDPDVGDIVASGLGELAEAALIVLYSTDGVANIVGKLGPSVVLVDTDTPGSFTLLKELKSDPGTLAIRVVGLMSRGVITARDVLRAGFDAAVAANNPTELLETVKEHLNAPG